MCVRRRRVSKRGILFPALSCCTSFRSIRWWRGKAQALQLRRQLVTQSTEIPFSNSILVDGCFALSSLSSSPPLLSLAPPLHPLLPSALVTSSSSLLQTLQCCSSRWSKKRGGEAERRGRRGGEEEEKEQEEGRTEGEWREEVVWPHVAGAGQAWGGGGEEDSCDIALSSCSPHFA